MSSINILPLPEKETERLKKLYRITFNDLNLRFIRTEPGNWVLPASYEKFMNRFAKWNLRQDDIYILSFPKNGTTWTQELVWCVNSNADMQTAKAVTMSERVPFLELPMVFNVLKDQLPSLKNDRLEFMECMPSPRILETHLSLELLPHNLLDTCKVVSCLRNPKDTVVSFYHHEKLLNVHGYTGNFPSYFDLFMDNLVMFSPYFQYTSELWKLRNHPNMCLLFFEDMKKDLKASINKVAMFLGKELSEEQVEKLEIHLSFRKMKENPSVNKDGLKDMQLMDPSGSFFRKGEVGDWKNYFTADMSKRMDAAIEKYLKPIGLEFRYE